MKLLIITQKVDKHAPILGFFHEWLVRFAKEVDELTVICLQKGEYNLPDNVRVLSLGKEAEGSKATYTSRFLRYIVQERKNYTHVLVHMNPEYVVLGGLLWRMLGKKLALWYMHKSVDTKLRIAEKFVDTIFTASKSSFRLPSKKVHIMGHGIDTNLFVPAEVQQERSKFAIVSVGRPSPIKDYETLIRAAEKLKHAQIDFSVDIIGGPVSKQEQEHFDTLKALVREKKLDAEVSFRGSVDNTKLPRYLQTADVLAHMSKTGSLDKVVLEAMSCGVPTISCNDAVQRDVLGEYRRQCGFASGDAHDLAKKLESFAVMTKEERHELGKKLRSIVVEGHSIDTLMKRIVLKMKNKEIDHGAVKGHYDTKIPDSFDGDYEYHRWFKNDLLKMGYEMTRDTLLRILPGFSYKKYIEVGCGPGTWTKFFTDKHPNAEYTLVDISTEMLGLAKKKLENVASVNFIESDFTKLDASETYDMFVSSRAIEYMKDKDAVVEKISSVLRSGGQGYIVTKTPKYLRNKLLGRKTSSFHSAQISPQRLQLLLQRHGMRDIVVYPVTMSFPLWKSVFLSKLLYTLFSRMRLNAVSQFFCESYVVVFKKV